MNTTITNAFGVCKWTQKEMKAVDAFAGMIHRVLYMMIMFGAAEMLEKQSGVMHIVGVIGEAVAIVIVIYEAIKMIRTSSWDDEVEE